MGDTMQDTNNKRIAKNTLFLYLRMFINMGISLYTSRIILNVLGTSDYGIYGVVGSVVVIFTFVNASLSAATSRFITFHMGKKDAKQLKIIFNTALWLHIGLAFIIIIVLESIGVWFLNNKLVIPQERMYAANWLLQFSVVSSTLGIIKVPFNATIISHERFDFFAYMSILGSLLKLGIIFLIPFFSYDKLIVYSALLLCVGVLMITIDIIYCKLNFKETKITYIYDKETSKAMLSFSGWSFYSNMCFTGRTQGTNFLLNIFGGTTINAAAGLATTTLNVMEQFATNLISASRPQIIKNFAQQNYKGMVELLVQTSILANTLYILIAIPFISELDYVLQLWLINVPPFMKGFCIFLILGEYISLNNNINYVALQASSRIRNYCILAGSTSIMVIPILYMIFKNGGSLYYAYGIPIMSNLIIFGYNLNSLRKITSKCNTKISTYVISSIIRPTICCIPTIILVVLIILNVDAGWNRLLTIILVSSISTCVFAYFFALSKKMRLSINNYITKNITWINL